jgi:hypothetical protein
LRGQSGAAWTHEFKGEDGKLFAVAMMHPDGLGPSRLLLEDALDKQFADGYLVALPEMSCAFALSKAASAPQRTKIDEVVERCFHGTRPLVRGLHDPSLLREENRHS